MKKSQLEKIPGIGRERASYIHQKEVFALVDKEMKFMEKNNVRPLYFIDKDFPSRLKNCEDAPLMIFYKGNANLNPERVVAVVGTRFITTYGKEMTEKLVQEFAEFNITLISGLAYGVDVQAHKVAMKHKIPTIGVVAHGLDRIYPSEHKVIADKMLEHGGIISEYPSMTKPDRNNFPARNRIVAGLSDAIIVVESAEKGGALITADLANDYNREVFALPGRVNDHFSKGCHQLIRQNKAMLFENALQIAEMMSWEDSKGKVKKVRQPLLFDALTIDEQKLIKLLTEQGMLGIDSLAIHAEMSLSRLSSLLLNLEFAGILRVHPGKLYELI